MLNRAKRRAGFTLVELVIVVAIIGILAMVAIPNFLSYQAKARRSEAFSNLAGIARIQQSYFAERNEFFEAGSFPNFDNYGGLGTTKMLWDSESQAEYAELGWGPEGQVYYAYDVNTGAVDCTCTVCFTATAMGDVDNDGDRSAVMYVHRGPAADGPGLGWCPSGYELAPPVDPKTEENIYDEVAVQRATDEY